MPLPKKKAFALLELFISFPPAVKLKHVNLSKHKREADEVTAQALNSNSSGRALHLPAPSLPPCPSVVADEVGIGLNVTWRVLGLPTPVTPLHASA